eukprot:5465645-Alexandrium_andersonii.AAC.1
MGLAPHEPREDHQARGRAGAGAPGDDRGVPLVREDLGVEVGVGLGLHEPREDFHERAVPVQEIPMQRLAGAWTCTGLGGDHQAR